MSQKEVVIGASIDKAQFSRIENNKTDPSFSTIEKIAKAMGCSIAELFASAEEIKDIHSHDKSLMEKLTLIETLSEEEKQTLFNILDAFVSTKKYKDTLSVTIPMKVNTLFRPKWTVVLMMISWVKIRQNYLLLFHFFSHGFAL